MVVGSVDVLCLLRFWQSVGPFLTPTNILEYCNVIRAATVLSKDTFSFNAWASLLVSRKAMYSAALIARTVMDCWLDRQLVAPPSG